MYFIEKYNNCERKNQTSYSAFVFIVNEDMKNQNIKLKQDAK